LGIHVVTKIQAALVAAVGALLIVGSVAALCVEAAGVVTGVLLIATAVLLYDVEAGSKR
jgi:hypothetical protein